jgi:hypothetical protein
MMIIVGITMERSALLLGGEIDGPGLAHASERPKWMVCFYFDFHVPVPLDTCYRLDTFEISLAFVLFGWTTLQRRMAIPSGRKRQ